MTAIEGPGELGLRSARACAHNKRDLCEVGTHRSKLFTELRSEVGLKDVDAAL